MPARQQNGVVTQDQWSPNSERITDAEHLDLYYRGRETRGALKVVNLISLQDRSDLTLL